MSEAMRSAAGKVLDLPADSPTESVRRALFESVSNSELFPDQLIRESAAVLGVPAKCDGRTPELSQKVEQSLSAEIEEFARGYWTFEPVQRQRRWKTLIGQCVSFPRLEERLTSMWSGLEAGDAPQLEDRGEVELVRSIRELYPMRVRERVRRRRQLIDWASPHSDVRTSAARLMRNQPDLLSIDHGLLRTLSSGRPDGPKIKPVLVVPSEPTQYEESPGLSGTSANRWVIFFVIFLAIAFIRGFVKLGGSDSSRQRDQYSSNRDSYSFPTIDPMKTGPVSAPSSLVAPRLTGLMTFTAGQTRLLRKVYDLPTLTDAEAAAYAKEFISFRAADVPVSQDPEAAKEWNWFRQHQMTSAQRTGLLMLSLNHMSEADVKTSLVRFHRSKLTLPPSKRKD